jgi:hypothetical protein
MGYRMRICRVRRKAKKLDVVQDRVTSPREPIVPVQQCCGELRHSRRKEER